jgi:hypothetical protein
MIYVLKIIWDYRVPLLELIVRNIARYPQSATSTSIRYEPAIRYLVPCRRDLEHFLSLTLMMPVPGIVLMASWNILGISNYR